MGCSFKGLGFGLFFYRKMDFGKLTVSRSFGGFGCCWSFAGTGLHHYIRSPKRKGWKKTEISSAKKSLHMGGKVSSRQRGFLVFLFYWMPLLVVFKGTGSKRVNGKRKLTDTDLIGFSWIRWISWYKKLLDGT